MNLCARVINTKKGLQQNIEVLQQPPYWGLSKGDITLKITSQAALRDKASADKADFFRFIFFARLDRAPVRRRFSGCLGRACMSTSCRGGIKFPIRPAVRGPLCDSTKGTGLSAPLLRTLQLFMQNSQYNDNFCLTCAKFAVYYEADKVQTHTGRW